MRVRGYEKAHARMKSIHILLKYKGNCRKSSMAYTDSYKIVIVYIIGTSDVEVRQYSFTFLNAEIAIF